LREGRHPGAALGEVLLGDAPEVVGDVGRCQDLAGDAERRSLAGEDAKPICHVTDVGNLPHRGLGGLGVGAGALCRQHLLSQIRQQLASARRRGCALTSA